MGVEAVDLPEVINLSEKTNVCSDLVHRDTYFVERVASVLTYSHTIEEEYGMPFLRAKEKDIV